MLSKNVLAAKVYWRPSATSTCPIHLPLPHTCCCGWSAASSGWHPHPSAVPSAGDLPAPSGAAQAFLPPPGSREQLTGGLPPESPHPMPVAPSHFIPLPLALPLPPVLQWLAAQSPAHPGTADTALPLPETHTQGWRPGTEWSTKEHMRQPQRPLWSCFIS